MMWLVRGYVWLLVIFGNVQNTQTKLTMYEDISFDKLNPSFYDASITKRTNPNSLPHHCLWLPECICRNESDYTNGTYQLMVNCSKSGLTDVPEFIPNVTTVLTLDENSIQDIKPGAFKNLMNLKYLDLSNNLIHRLNKNVFEGLGNLRTLEISGNKIRYDKHSLPFSVFKPIRNLERLNLHQAIDNLNTSIEYYPTEALSELKSLKQLFIDGIRPKNISLAFSDMKNLRTLDLSSKCGRCRLSKIVVDMFKNINSVYDLKISNCSLDFVENGSFAEIENLTSLDLSYNEKLHFKSLANITYGLQNKKLMREIKLVKIHETFGDCTRIEKDHLQYFKNVTVQNLHVDFNRLAYVSEDAVAYIPRSLQKLTLSNNMLLAGEYIHKMFEESVFTNLNFLTMAEQRMNYDAVKFFDNKTRHMLSSMSQTYLTYTNGFEKEIEQETQGIDHLAMTTNQTTYDGMSKFCGNCHARGVVNYETVLYIPPGLKDLDLSGLRISNELRNICFCEPNSLWRMNLERNVFYSWQSPISGLSKLLSLNLAWNSCDNLSEDFFDQFESLEQLNLTRNFIERFLRNDIEGRIFRPLKKLFSLVLIDNKISSIPLKLFQGLESLAVLDLSYNFLTEIDLVFNKRPLQFLDLHNNLLKKIGPGIIKKFNKDSKKDIPYRYLDLRNNSLSCACPDIEFVKWISQTKVTLRGLNEYTCKYVSGSIERLSSAKEIYKRLFKDCADYTWVIISACFGIVLFLIIAFGGLIHRYRWDLRYVYYTIKLKMKGNKKITMRDDEEDFKYDAFISYANEDTLFVMDSLIPKLEKERNLKLLVHGRDFIAGKYVFDNIMQAIKTSRKTLILMSKAFLNSEWCIFEMNMARLESIKTGRNVICLLMIERVSTSGLPLEVIDIIRQKTYFELPTDIQITNEEWNRLHEALID